ncbi:MAG: choice-of-anchor Q domain-containing protein, partial [Candidatus Desantisbacteria bacterium]
NYFDCSVGTNDIHEDPRFIGEVDYHLQSTSPCIDAGSNTATHILSTDKDGNPRIVNGTVDMGAYEYQIVIPPSVLSISPDKGGNAGAVTVKIIGRGFQEGAVPKLRKSGQDDIVGTNTIYSSNRLTTTFDLTGKEPGIWDVVVENPGKTLILQDGFTIEQGGEPKLWVEIVGRDQIRVGREQTYWIRYGNAGNVDAWAVWLGVQIPANTDCIIHPTGDNDKKLNIPTSITPWVALFLLGQVPTGITKTQLISISIPAMMQKEISLSANISQNLGNLVPVIEESITYEDRVMLSSDKEGLSHNLQMRTPPLKIRWCPKSANSL